MFSYFEVSARLGSEAELLEGAFESRWDVHWTTSVTQLESITGPNKSRRQGCIQNGNEFT